MPSSQNLEILKAANENSLTCHGNQMCVECLGSWVSQAPFWLKQNLWQSFFCRQDWILTMGGLDNLEYGLHMVLGLVGVCIILVVSLVFLCGARTEKKSKLQKAKESEERRRSIIPEFSTCNAKCSDRRQVPTTCTCNLFVHPHEKAFEVFWPFSSKKVFGVPHSSVFPVFTASQRIVFDPADSESWSLGARPEVRSMGGSNTFYAFRNVSTSFTRVLSHQGSPYTTNAVSMMVWRWRWPVHAFGLSSGVQSRFFLKQS